MTTYEAFEKWWPDAPQLLTGRELAAYAFGAGWGARDVEDTPRILPINLSEQIKNAGLAQLAEQAVCSGQVVGSTPAPGSISAEDIWAKWPVKKARGAAIKAIQKAMKKESPAALLDAVMEFRAAYEAWPEEEKRFLPMCSTFMNQERWADDRAAWRKCQLGQTSRFSVHH